MAADLDRFRNAGFNAALAVLFVVVAVLLYAFVIRWTGPDPAPLTRAAGSGGDIIQVDVRNGCGVSGLAADMTEFLRLSGFDVVEMGDYDDFDQSRSFVIDRTGDPAAARELARIAGIPADRIQTDIRDDYFLDATIVIGSDYDTIRPFRDNDQP